MKNILTEDRFADIHKGNTGVTYCDLLMVALRSAPNDKGVDSARIMKHFPIVQRLEKVQIDEEIQLSKEDWGIVDSAWKEKSWPFIADSIGSLTMELDDEMKLVSAK